MAESGKEKLESRQNPLAVKVKKHYLLLLDDASQ
jgi:hypothetical protein